MSWGNNELLSSLLCEDVHKLLQKRIMCSPNYWAIQYSYTVLRDIVVGHCV